MTHFRLEHNFQGNEISKMGGGGEFWVLRGEEFGMEKEYWDRRMLSWAVMCYNLLPITSRALSFREAEM